MSQITADLGSLSQQEFRVGRAVSKAFEVFSRNAIPFSIVGAFVWLPAAIAGLLSIQLQLPANQRGLAVGLATLLVVILQPLATAAILHAAFQYMRGRPVRMGESILRGLARFFPLLGASILVGLGVMLGFILLIVPGLMLFARWYIVSPVCVVERQGPLGSLRRSAVLTKGNRWKIFGTYLVLIIVGLIAGQILTLVSSAAAPVAAIAAQAIFQGIWNAFGAVLIVVMYHDLRVAKEGVDIERIASVFD